MLIVEDDVDLRDLIAEFLNDDYELVTAGTADQGLAAARQARPEIILCDLNMPGRIGLHTVREVRNDPTLSHVPIILMSGQEQPAECSQLQVVFLPKPFDMPKLMQVIQNAFAAAGN